MNSHRQRRVFVPLVRMVTAAAVTTWLVACGGGGGGGDGGGKPLSGNVLKGVALTGEALVNADIAVSDSTGAVCANAKTGGDGAWASEVNACNAGAYLIKASGIGSDGEVKNYYSAATQEDVTTTTKTGSVVTVSQLTDAIVKVALKNDTPETATAANLQALNPDTLKAASVQVLKLLPADVLTNIDPSKDVRTLAVTAGSGVGLDKVLDRVPRIAADMSSSTKSLVAVVTGYGSDGKASINTGATVDANGSVTTSAAGEVVAGITVTAVADATPSALASITPEKSAEAEVQMLVAQIDRLWKTGVPATGSIAATYSDGCYLSGGATKKLNIDRNDGKLDFTADYMKSTNLYRVGSTRSNFKLLSLTPSNNGRTKVAVVSYDISYKDGTKALATEHTLVWGDSSPLCASNGLDAALAQNNPAWRFAGDTNAGQKVNISVEARNRLIYTHSIVDGTFGITATSTASVAPELQNRLDFYVSDPRNLGYTYAVVTGPTLPTAGIKLVLPYIYNTAPELAGKSGNYLNNTSIYESARICSSGSGSSTSWNADAADCVTNGLGGLSWKISDSLINGLTGNDSYTFKIYNDDGWKTVNGQSTKTPALTYTTILKAKPFTTAFTAADYPKITLDSLGVSKFLSAAKGNGDQAITGQITPINVPIGAPAFALSSAWNFSSGRRDTNTYWPQYRKNDRVRLTSDATSLDVIIKGKLPEMNKLDYTEAGISTSNRNGHVIETLYVYK